MARQTAVAISDIFVALSAFYCMRLSEHLYYGIVGFFLIGLAAWFGVIRFALERPPSWLTYTHITASWIAKLFGMPALSIAYLRVTENPLLYYENYMIVSAIVIFLVTKFLPRESKQTPTDAISGLAVIGIVINSYHVRLYGIFGAVGYLMAGIIQETGLGAKFIPPTASFHYIIAAANLCLMWGLIS